MSANAYSLLVFDWDGTLADSEHRILEAVRMTVRDLGLPERTAAEIRNVIGLGMKECMETLFPEESPDRYRGFIDAYREHFLSRQASPVTLFPGAAEVLGWLQAGGYTIAVATGKSRRGLDRELEESGLDTLVQVSRCADEAPSKPHPQMLHDVLELAQTEPHDALMIGDTTYDLQMARDAGVDRVAVSYGAHEIARLLEFHPLEVVDSLFVLRDWLSDRREGE